MIRAYYSQAAIRQCRAMFDDFLRYHGNGRDRRRKQKRKALIWAEKFNWSTI